MQDGYSLKSYGVSDGSLLHPLFGWRDGGAGSDDMARLLRAVPWQETEWYAAAASSGVAAAASFLQGRLGSLGAAAPPSPPSTSASQNSAGSAADAVRGTATELQSEL